MTSVLRAIVMGPKGVGKSQLSNILLELSSDAEEYFLEYNDPSGRRAFGCQLIQNEISDGTSLRLVDMPGIDVENPNKSKNWQNVVHAFDLIEKQVDSFLIVLDANKPKAGKNLIEFFVTMFGEIAATNAVVVFVNSKYSDRKNSERVLRVTHRYLDQLLLAGYPLVDANNFSTQRKTVVDLIKTTADGRQYTIDDFKDPQFFYTRRWVNDIKQVAGNEIERNKCIEIGVPDILFDRYSEDELVDFIKKRK